MIFVREEVAFMPYTDPEAFQATPRPNRDRSGTIVLSSDFRLLFIDNSAIEFAEILNSGASNLPLARGLPPCLMELAQEIAATDSDRQSDNLSRIRPLCRIVGPPARAIQVRGFRIQGQEVEDGRLVLILSRSSHGTAA